MQTPLDKYPEDYSLYADILQFSEGEEMWTRVGEMSLSRSNHAVTTVNFNDFKKYCQ